MMQKGVFTVDEAAGEFRADFLDEERVRSWLFRKLNPAGPRCAHCGEGVLPGRAASTFWAGGRVCCKRCGKYFTASTGTMISGAALSEREIFLVALLLGLEVPVAEIAEVLGRTEETVRFWRGKLAFASEFVSPGPEDFLPPQGRGPAAEGAGDDSPFPEGFTVRGSLLDVAVCQGLPPGSFAMFTKDNLGKVGGAVLAENIGRGVTDGN